MLLHRFVEYADRIERSETKILAPRMYEKTPVRWIINLDQNGRFINFELTSRGSTTRKDRGKEMFAPHAMRTSTAIVPKLLADTAEYALGIPRASSEDETPAKQEQRLLRIEQCHQQFIALISRCAEQTKLAEVHAVANFLQSSSATYPEAPP